MGLKPSPMQAVLVQEAVVQSIKSGSLDYHEEELMQDFCNDIDLYLVGAPSRRFGNRINPIPFSPTKLSC